MASRITGDESLPLLKGTLDLLILKTLTWGAMHGFGIASWLERNSDGSLGIDDSSLYQSLHRLEARGYIEAEWGISENNRRARFYLLTAAGKRQLRVESDTWTRYAATVSAILSLTPRRARP
jgi:PadR family transcriptional regulator PadR